MKKFQRTSGRSYRNTADNVGTVQVRVALLSHRGVVAKGNRMRSFSVRQAKVSEVFAAIEKALFND